ncbi:ribosomal protein L15 family protein [Helicobacter pylori]|nr:ribosomal protein L15 family protein [Helicobacter pylori]
MGLKSLNCSFWCFLWGMQKPILNYKAILHQHPMRTKLFKRALKRGFYRLIEPKSLKIFNLDRLLWLSLKP